MKALFRLFLVSSCLLLCDSASAQKITTVVIDAGHGGHDTGATKSKVLEKHLNLDVSRRVERTLRENGLRVVMVRSKDNFVELGERTRIANKYRNSVFVSVHFNYSYKNTVSGIETFYTGSKGSQLARYVQEHLIKDIGGVDRGVKKANFYVLNKTKAPACLVEGGFLTSQFERDALLEGKRRQIIADAIAKGVLDYINK